MKIKQLLCVLSLVLLASLSGLLLNACGSQSGKNNEPVDRKIEVFSTPMETTCGYNSQYVVPSYFATDSYGMKHAALVQVYDATGEEVTLDEKNSFLVEQDVNTYYTAVYKVNVDNDFSVRSMRIVVREDGESPVLSMQETEDVVMVGDLFDISDYFSVQDDSGVVPHIRYTAKFNGEEFAYSGGPISAQKGTYSFTIQAVDYSNNASPLHEFRMVAREPFVVANFEVESDISTGRPYTRPGSDESNGVIAAGHYAIERSKENVFSGEYSCKLTSTGTSEDTRFFLARYDGATNGASLFPFYAMFGFHMYFEPIDDSGFITFNYRSRDWGYTNVPPRGIITMNFYADGELLGSGPCDGTQSVTVPTGQWIYVDGDIYEYANPDFCFTPVGYSSEGFVAYIDDITLGVRGETDVEDINLGIYGKEKITIDLESEINGRICEYYSNTAWKKSQYEVVRVVGEEELPVEMEGNTITVEKGEFRVYLTNAAGVRAGRFVKLNVTDSIAYEMQFDTWGNHPDEMPDGEVGKEYPFPETTVPQGISVTRQVLKNGVDILGSDSSFIPNEAGVYTLRFVISDGKQTDYCDFDINILPADSLQIIKTNFNEVSKPSDGIVGYWIQLPQITAEGGSGVLTETVSVKDITNDEEYVITDNRFLPQKKGTYRVTYTVRDYFDIVSQSFDIEIEFADKPTLAVLPSLPNAFVNGVSYTIHVEDAIYYSESGEQRIPVTMFWVYNGKEYAFSDITFVPSVVDNGDTIIIRYKAGDLTVDSEPVPVVIPKHTDGGVDISKLFVAENATVVTVPFNSETKTNSHVSISTNRSDAKVSFANSLIAHNFNFLFDVVANTNHAEGILIRMTDAVSPNILIEILIERSPTDTQGSVISVNGGKKYPFSGSFSGGSMSLFNLRYNNHTFNITDSSGSNVVSLNDGVFNGFTSGLVKLDVEFVGVSGDFEMRCYSLNGQVLSDVKFDGVVPGVQELAELIPLHNVGDTIVIPEFLVSDVIDPDAWALISVMAPDKTFVTANGVLLDDAPAQQYSFQANLPGTYTLTVYVSDHNGNYRNIPFQIYVVQREEPTLTVNGKVPNRGNVNKEINVPTAAGADFNGDELDVLIFIKNPNGLYLPVEDGTFTPDRVGEYEIIYYVFDSYNNYKIVSYNVSVGD